MKLFDKKGRLFGKLNIIDLLVILLVVAVIAAVGVKLTGTDLTQSNQLTNGEMKDVSYSVLCRMVHVDVADALEETEVGKQLMSNGELVESCYITGVERRPYYETYLTEDGEIRKVPLEDYCELLFTIGGEAPYVENSYLIGTQEIRVGKSHIVKTVTMELTGTVMEMEGANG